MTADPDDIRLGNEERKLLRQAESRTGKPWRQLLRELLSEVLAKPEEYPWTTAQEAAFEKVWDNEEDAVYDEL